jgi:hypothetical protein
MGGWCVRREKCTNYHADSAQIAERLCQPGEANAFSPIKEVNMSKLSKGLIERNERQKQQADARKAAVLAMIDDTGRTVEQMSANTDGALRRCMNQCLVQLCEEGKIFRAMVSKKFLGTGLSGSNFLYFASQAAATSRQQQYEEFASQNRLQRDRDRHAKKRHANQKPLTVRKPTQKQANTAQMLARVRIMEASNHRGKGDNTPAVPPPGKQIQVLPGFTGGNRYTVDGPVIGPFSSLKPGQYAFEASSAAARAAA